ncbi:calcium-binding protein [Streptomyces rugosispiralis]|uniref:Calcium-binding protein n=1 Tax=Streptomyces rugosispiralis TaxID=2967341 RepID=A0ABT1V8S0_9ACTN|nr:calcium-binding protein [Streptomyces rugosispiralis]MCQ8193795.1 calcium-binding protein [Streptomyces rugosispiralis]
MSTLGPRSRRVRPVGVAALLAVAASTGLFAWNAQAATSPASSSPVSSAASPATVTVTDGVMAYTAADGQTNKLTIKRVSETDTTLTFGIDDVVEITAGTGCTHPTATDLTYVTCTVPVPDPDHGGDQGNVELGDGNDSARISGGDVNVDGGTGDDTIIGASVAVGGDGDDTISHATNANGNGGNDTITDSFAVWAGDGDDTVIGNDVANEIYGGPGNDYLDGAGNDDSIDGGEGDDIIKGGPGNDYLFGGPGQDDIDGGPGDNVIDQDGSMPEGF